MSLLNDRRTLLDIVTGGRYKTSKDIPQIKEWAIPYLEFLTGASAKTESYKPGIADIAMAIPVLGATGRVIKKASTAGDMFRGWRQNLEEYASTLSKKQRKRSGIDRKISEAWDEVGYDVDADNIKAVQSKLISLNRNMGFGQSVVVPDIGGVAGGVARRSKMPRGDVVKKQQKVINRQSTDVAAEKRKKFHQERIDKGLYRGSRRSGIY
jgi:hypothetical protein